EAAEPAKAIDDALEALHDAIAGIFASAFVLEHEHLWLVAQRGYATVPDGFNVERGVVGRAVRLGLAQLVADVHSDPDYVPALPGVVSELAIPLRVGRIVVGALNIESERLLPEAAADLLRPLTVALASLAEALRATKLDLAALARLFVQFSSFRDAGEIAALAAASVSKVLSIEASQVVVWDDAGRTSELARWRSELSDLEALSSEELVAARTLVDPNVRCQLLEGSRLRGRSRRDRTVVWLPLRVNGTDIGSLVAVSRAGNSAEPDQLDTAAVLAAHVAASLDAAFAFQRERKSAVTDSLTGILNRRGLEERLDSELALAQERRLPVSLLVIDCDDFKEINDRAGHEFGDALLHEVARILMGAVPMGAEAARFGGDEFVVMLPGAGAESAAALGGRIRDVLAAGLTDAGFPLRISAGISTYPFDGAAPSALLRAADQALYVAKSAGKDRIASFRDVVGPGTASFDGRDAGAEIPLRGRGTGSVLSEVVAAAAAIEAEKTVEAVCSRLCKSLVFVVGATACSASKVDGEYLVDATEHALREVWLGEEATYRISDFPLTAETLRTGRPCGISFLDGEVDPAEAFILRDLSMNALLMLPLWVAGRPWGLVELYERRLRSFTESDAGIARLLATQAERRLEVVASESRTRLRPRVYELPPDDGETAGSR
ncbi:MAG: diguanylate cyclase, partial [Actinobacteria bacterium]|nr:diguanylate cyclase [Actinomycetota bacterium]